MNLIDTHTHIYLDTFAEDGLLLFERAASAGVSKMLMPAIDSSTHQEMIQLEEQFPQSCFAMIGLHPCSVKENYVDELKVVEQFLNQRSFKAVGETGLDFYWDKTFTAFQYNSFRKQIEWALDYNLPVVIHSRESTDECIEVIAEHQDGKLKGVFHCFSGTAKQAQQVIDLGFLLGIGGVLTFKNAGLDKALENIDMRHIILETDAPYLAPVPFRGKRNEPAYLPYVVSKLAEIKSCSEEEVATVTTENAIGLFGDL